MALQVTTTPDTTPTNLMGTGYDPTQTYDPMAGGSLLPPKPFIGPVKPTVSTKKISTPSVYSSSNAKKIVDSAMNDVSQWEQSAAMKSMGVKPVINPDGSISYVPVGADNTATGSNGTTESKPTSETKPTTTESSTGNWYDIKPEDDIYTKTIKQNYADNQVKDQQFQEQLTNLQNGTTPLTATQQAIIDNIKSSAERAKRQQEEINRIELGNKTMAGVRSGRSRYTTETQDSFLSDLQTTQLQRITDIDTKALELINQTKQSFTEKSFDMVYKSYNAWKESQKEKNTAIMDLMKTQNEREKLAQQALKDKRAEQQDINKYNLDVAKFNWELEKPKSTAEAEYQFYAQQQKEMGKQPVDFDTWQTKDANRKRSVTNIYSSGEFNTKEIAAVEAIIKANPGQWGKAADAINKKFGEGAATRYDSMLQEEYALPSKARELSTLSYNNYEEWQAAREAFIKEYGWSDKASNIFDELVPQPSKTNKSRINLQ